MQAAENLTDQLYIVVAKSGAGVAAYAAAAALLLLRDKREPLVQVAKAWHPNHEIVNSSLEDSHVVLIIPKVRVDQMLGILFTIQRARSFALHLVPSGILNEEMLCVIVNGVVVHLPGLFEEIDGLESNGVSCKGRIMVSDRAHMLFDFHQVVDGLREAELANSFIGTTNRGIGPCYSSKMQLQDFQVSSPDMLREEVENYKQFAERLEPFIADTVQVMHESIAQKKKNLVEGGQATMLDIDFGTFAFVTSSSPSAGGICTGLGIAPRVVGDLIGVGQLRLLMEVLVQVKAYTTRVGLGPFPTEILGKVGDLLRFAGQEFGVTTGRPHCCGWLDVDCEVMPGWQCDISSIRNYSDLPKEARQYVERIEELVSISTHYIGVTGRALMC
ncbi:adenylosuccinate synthase [Actinidia rufa]|uniref:Adenylosuccinate synthetase, chloroplastic n=1 Tax=Actinidia rufa TaxID=165716 RepID=A0A7J0GU30_9ERIC|nr:adenylosuccinate synthase [Actinidia rufa]